MKALDRKVWLPSGGSLVIDRTEAMTVVDVNTGKFVGSGGNLEQTVTRNNMEAAEEIVRQLRLRDIGGIIVIDFIDMVLESNRDLVLRRLTECLGRDRTKHQVAEVTSLGLVQMTRKRVGQGLLEVFSEPCEHCRGRGVIVSHRPGRREAPQRRGAGGNGGGTRRRRRRERLRRQPPGPPRRPAAGRDADAGVRDRGAAGRAGRRGRRDDRGHPHRRPAQPRTPRPRAVGRGPRGRGRRRPRRRAADRRRAPTRGRRDGDRTPSPPAAPTADRGVRRPTLAVAEPAVERRARRERAARRGATAVEPGPARPEARPPRQTRQRRWPPSRRPPPAGGAPSARRPAAPGGPAAARAAAGLPGAPTSDDGPCRPRLRGALRYAGRVAPPPRGRPRVPPGQANATRPAPGARSGLRAGTQS